MCTHTLNTQIINQEQLFEVVELIRSCIGAHRLVIINFTLLRKYKKPFFNMKEALALNEDMLKNQLLEKYKDEIE